MQEINKHTNKYFGICKILPLLWGMKQIFLFLLLIVGVTSYGQDINTQPKEVKCQKYVYSQEGELIGSIEKSSLINEIWVNEETSEAHFTIDREIVITKVLIKNQSVDTKQYILQYGENQFTLDVLDNRYFRLNILLGDEELLYTGLLN